MKIDNMIFDDYNELAAYMLEVTDEDRFSCVVMKYEKARQLVKELASFVEIQIGCIELSNEAWNGYDKEYYVTLATYEEDVYELSVEPAWHEACVYHSEGYFTVDGAIVFIDSDANSAILNHIGKSSKVIEIEMNIDDYDCDTCECREECYGDDEEVNEALKEVLDYLYDILFN